MMSALTAACAHSGSTVTDASGLPIHRTITSADLLRLPESRLRYPGSTIVKRVAMDQTPNGDPEDPNPAYTGAIFTATASPDQLYAWYDSALSGLGFERAVYFRPADQSSGEAWQFHHRRQVQVGVFDPALLRRDTGLAPRLSAGQIVYQAVLVGYVPGLPKY